MLHRAVFQRLFFMSSDVIISVEGLGKKYRIQHNAERQRYTALRDVIAEKAKGFFKKLKSEDKSESRKQKSENAESSNTFQLSQSQLSTLPDPQFPLSTFPISTLPRSEDFWALKDVSFSVRQCMSVLPEPTGNTTG